MYNYNYEVSYPVIAAYALVALISIVCMWRIFSKHYGVAGWKSIIPFYNVYTMSRFTFNNGLVMFYPAFTIFVGMAFLFLLNSPAGLIIYSVFAFIALVLSAVISFKFAKQLNDSTLFAVLYILIPVIGLPCIAFSENTAYKGPTKF